MMDWQVHKGFIPRPMCKAVTRKIWQELRLFGVTPEQIAEWSVSSWFPHMRWEPEILAIQDMLGRYCSGAEWGTPQILVRLPDFDHDCAEGPGLPHLDELPDWAIAKGLVYKRIFGVELTSTPPRGGGTVIHHRLDTVRIQQRAGDVLSFDPSVYHSGSPNQSGNVRMALFFRRLVKETNA